MRLGLFFILFIYKIFFNEMLCDDIFNRLLREMLGDKKKWLYGFF